MSLSIPRATVLVVMLFASAQKARAENLSLSPSECAEKWYIPRECPQVIEPDQACRMTEYIKKWGINPDDPSLRVRKLAGTFLFSGADPKQEFVDGHRVIVSIPISYENLQIRICAAYKKYQCATLVKNLYVNDNAIVEKYLRSSPNGSRLVIEAAKIPNPDLNIKRNLEYFLSENEKFAQGLLDIIEAEKATSTNVTDYPKLAESDRKTIARFQTIKKELIELSIKEKALMALIDEMVKEIGLNAAATLGETAGYECDFQNEFKTSKHNNLVKEITDLFNAVKNQIDSQRDSRHKLANITYLKVKYFAYSNLAIKMGSSIQSVADDLNKDLWLSRALLEYGDWWSSVTVNGIARDLHTKYYFYSEPLRLLKTQKEHALKVVESIKNNPVYTEINGGLGIKTINDNVALLDRNISFIETKGWNGLLDLQKISAQKRADLLPNNQSCQDANKKFQQGAKSVVDVDSFDSQSFVYKLSVEACKNRTAKL